MAQVPALIVQWEAASNKKKLFTTEVDITSEHVWGSLIILASLLPCCRRRRVRQIPPDTVTPIWVSKTGQVFHKKKKCPGSNTADQSQVRELRACSFCFGIEENKYKRTVETIITTVVVTGTLA